MPKQIWNEGRVVGYSAYELYVRRALSIDPNIKVATEQEWLASSLAAGSSLILQVPTVSANEGEESYLDIALPRDCRLRGANSIIASFFDGSGVIDNNWLVRVTDYGQLISNSSTSGHGYPTGIMSDIADLNLVPTQPLDIAAKLDQMQDYLRIVDGIVLQSGTWTRTDFNEPAADLIPDISNPAFIRLHVVGPITHNPLVLLTGFTDSAVLSGTSALSGSTNTPDPENGDFLGPAVIPWSAKILFTVPTYYAAYLQDQLGDIRQEIADIEATSHERIEDTEEVDKAGKTFSTPHMIAFNTHMTALSGTSDFTSVKSPYWVRDGWPKLFDDEDSEEAYHIPEYREIDFRIWDRFDSLTCAYIISASDSFAQPRPDAEPIVTFMPKRPVSNDVSNIAEADVENLFYHSVGAWISANMFGEYPDVPAGRYIGYTQTPVYQGSTATSVIIDGVQVTPQAGDIVTCRCLICVPIAVTQTSQEIQSNRQLTVTPNLPDSWHEYSIQFKEFTEGQIIYSSDGVAFVKTAVVIDDDDQGDYFIARYFWVKYNVSETFQDPDDSTNTITVTGRGMLHTYSDFTFICRYRGSTLCWCCLPEYSRIGVAPDYNEAGSSFNRITAPIQYKAIPLKDATQYPVNVLGDSSTEITDGDNQSPTINGIEIDTHRLSDGDVVRYANTCYRWTTYDGERWVQLTPVKYGIAVWLSGRMSVVPARWWWTLQWRIPADRGVAGLHDNT